MTTHSVNMTTMVDDSPSASSSFLPPFDLLFGSPHVKAGSWDNVVGHMKPVLYYIPMIIACYVVAVQLLTKYTDWRGLKLQKLAGQLSMYPPFVYLVITSHGATFDRTFWGIGLNGGGPSARFLESDVWCDHFAMFYIAVNIVQAIGQIQTERAPLLYQLMAHHVLSIFCYSAGFYFDRFRWWTTLAGCCELTNIFLVPVFASKEYFPEWRKERWFLWNSRLLWITFVTHRLILFPCWLALWVSDRWQMATSPTAATDPGIHWVEGVLYPLTILGLFLLSVIWFRTIDRGLKKQTVIYLEAQGGKKIIANGTKTVSSGKKLS